MQHRIVFALACVAALGCGDTSGPQVEHGQVVIRTGATTYQPVQLVVVTTTNLSGHTIYDDHCGGEVQGYEFLHRWNASYGAARACVDVDARDWRAHSAAIPGNSIHVDTFHVNSRAYSGTWRVRLDLWNEIGMPLPEAQSTSNTFQVHGTWSP